MKRKPTTPPDSPALVNPPYEMPTTFQLAQLAAGFLSGKPFDFEDTKAAVSRAVLLWKEAHNGLVELQASRSNGEAIKHLESNLPKIINEWPKDANQKHCIVDYKEGVAAMFPHDKTNSRDGLMLELLVFLAKDHPDQELGRENWRRLKREGFTFQEFHSISYALTSWRAERRSSANTANARKGAKKTKKELGG